MLVELPYVFFPLVKHVRKSTQNCWPIYLQSVLYRLRETKADGHCSFRAFSVLLTGTEHGHRLAIVQHLLDNEQLFNSQITNSMEDYIVAYQMQSSGWGGTTDIFALAHMFSRRVYNFSRVSRSWNENCPTLIDRSPDSPHGDHYEVVMSVSDST